MFKRFACLFVLMSVIQAVCAKDSERLHIAVASNFKHSLQVLVPAFKTKMHLESLNVIISSGSSGVLFAQIKTGAPYDVFLSADAQRPDLLIEDGLADKSTRKVYARGQIVLWAPAYQQGVEIGILKNSLVKFTLANPKLAPYGQAAKQLMLKAGLWKEHDGSRIVAQNIAGAFQYLASGIVKRGWVAFSQLQHWRKTHEVSLGSYWLPPLKDYPPIEQVAVKLSASARNEMADLFLRFLSLPEAHDLIKNDGYLVSELKE
jgi:molybdate transport system substrate-binding protein